MLKIGDVLRVPFFPHQENSSEGEQRWVIIIEESGDEVTIVPLSTKIHQRKNYSKTILVTKNSKEGKQMGLPYDSIIICDRTKTLKKKFYNKSHILGNCPQNLLDKIIDLT